MRQRGLARRKIYLARCQTSTPSMDASARGARSSHSGFNKVKGERLGEAINLWQVHAPGERPGALDYIEAGANYRAQDGWTTRS